MMPLFKKLSLSTLTLFGVFALGALVGIFVYDLRESRCEDSYRFINPEVVCDKQPILKKIGYAATQGVLEKFIAEEKAAGRLTEAALYFRDLEDGPVFGVDETADFAPASLLKLPLALVYLTQAERDPEILKEQLSVAKPQWNFSEYYPPTETIDPAVPHTIEDLIAHMLTYSDNNSYGVLQTHLYDTRQKSVMTQTFLELGFIDPANISDETLSVRRYAAIFRALYNISYLNAGLSEKVLGWLAESDFALGLRGDVPESVPIAHKFGERSIDDGVKQLHDCGIVYYPGNPYVLCVMTRGANFDDLAAVIRRISSVVYAEVDSRRIK